MTTMELFVTRAGPYALGFAADQIAWVAPCPAEAVWPPPADGGLATIATASGATLRVVDTLTYLEYAHVNYFDVRASGRPQSAWFTMRLQPSRDLPYDHSRGSIPRERPATILAVSGSAMALAVEGYALAEQPVVPAPAVLRDRGVYALAPSDDGFVIVLDLARLVTDDLDYSDRLAPNAQTLIRV